MGDDGIFRSCRATADFFMPFLALSTKCFGGSMGLVWTVVSMLIENIF